MDETRKACEEYMKYLRSEDWCEEGLSDYENDIFEKAMTDFLGKEIWEEINNIIE